MSTWLLDTALFNMLATPKAKPLHEWCEANKPSLFISAESLTEISAAIGKMSASRWQRGDALRIWFDEITKHFEDRIHPVDAAIAIRAGGVLPNLTNAHPRHRFHDALLIATAQHHGHGLVTRRDGILGPWTQTPITTV
jgi:predicted nucleic acid-binding protein